MPRGVGAEGGLWVGRPEQTRDSLTEVGSNALTLTLDPSSGRSEATCVHYVLLRLGLER